jgi:hypothetical protein
MRLKEFHQEYPQASGPPKRLQTWIDAAAADTDVPEHPDDNQPIKLGRGPKKRRRNRKISAIWPETQTTQRNQRVDQRVDQRPTQPTQWRTLLVSCPTQYYLEIGGSR